MTQAMNQPTTPRPCIHCGWLTRSVVRVCQDCKPVGKRPERPCSGCKKTTTSKNGLCQTCRKPKPRKDTGVERICAQCGIEPTTRVDGNCYGCALALKDDESTRGLEESRYDLDALGDWRFDPFRRVQIWVPTLEQVDPRDEVAIKRKAHTMAEEFTQLPGLDPEATPECELPECSNRFVRNTKRHRYCSESCKDKAYYRRKKGQAA